jgi:O-antigen ligase
MKQLRELYTTKKFEISIVLCLVLPPIGIFLLTVLSFSTIYQTIKSKKPFNRSLFSIFLLFLLIATVGSVCQMHNGMLVVESLMILVYWGIYQRIFTSKGAVNFEHYRWIIIFGGLYNCILDPVNKWAIGHPIIGFLTGTGLIGDSPVSNYKRLIGSGYNPNFTMFLILLAMAFVFAEMLIRIQKKKYKFIGLLLLLLPVLSLGVLETGSRAGYITMVCIYALFLIRLSKILFVTVSLVLLCLIKPLVHLMPRNTSIDSSYLGRKEIWINAIKIWTQHPLFGTTQLGFRQEYIRLFHLDIPHAHDIFIGFFAEYGLVGGVPFLFLVAITVYKCANLFFLKRGNKGLLNYFLLSLPVIVFTGILDEPVYSPQIALVTIILMSFWEKYSSRIRYAYMAIPSVRSRESKERSSYKRAS